MRDQIKLGALIFKEIYKAFAFYDFNIYMNYILKTLKRLENICISRL